MKNLPYDATEDKVGDYFTEKCGAVENVRFVYNSVHKHFKGFAYIDFKFNSSLRKAIKENSFIFGNRNLYIDVDTSSKKAGFKLK